MTLDEHDKRIIEFQPDGYELGQEVERARWKAAVMELIEDLEKEQQQAIKDYNEHPEIVSFDLSEGYCAAYQDCINKLKSKAFEELMK
jgi:DNA integrity scanning protein DisA with diadenylate cyclase activity